MFQMYDVINRNIVDGTEMQRWRWIAINWHRLRSNGEILGKQLRKFRCNKRGIFLHWLNNYQLSIANHQIASYAIRQGNVRQIKQGGGNLIVSTQNASPPSLVRMNHKIWTRLIGVLFGSCDVTALSCRSTEKAL